MTPTILLYILDGLDDLTTLLFTHYFTIDYRPHRLKPTVFKSAPPPSLRSDRLFKSGPSPPPMLRIGPPP